MKPFIQVQKQSSTLEHWDHILNGNKLRSFAAFAYVTDSGVAQVSSRLRRHFENSRHSQWLFSFDYGRSHPTALRTLKKIENSAIRIHDGEYVVQSSAFIPRTCYHLKTALTLQKSGYPVQQVVGSGNLSASGLLSGIEAGCAIDYSEVRKEHGKAIAATLEDMWEKASPLDDVIDDYERRYEEIVQPKTFELDHGAEIATAIFWIDVGYVTKNRGPDRPGNQFDLPRGSHVYLGLKKVRSPVRNSVIGDLNFKTPDGLLVERRLRFGNNEMEKLTLPVPEQHGYESYDGKILTFKRAKDVVILECFERDDFFQIYGMHISSCGEMRSGRKYGTISLRG